MDEKFSLNDIVQSLAEQTGIEPAKSEQFINELVEVINKGIRKDGVVKIKGFGTFKILLIKERESVHVNTGERIVIPPHHKLSFKPDDGLKELINKPFSIFETIEATDEDLKKVPESATLDKKETIDIQHSDNKDIISDYEIIKEDSKNIVLSEDEKENADIVPPTKAPIIQKEEKNISLPEKEITTDPALKDKPITKAVISDEEAEAPWLTNKITEKEAIEPISTRQPKRKSKKTKRSSMTPLYIILVLLLCILAGCIWYYFSYSRSFDSFNKNYTTQISGESFTLPGDTIAEQQALEKSKIVEDTISQTAPNTTTQQQPAGSSSNETTASATTVPATNTTPSPSNSTNGVLAKITIEPGNRLTMLASKYYGNKLFWVYIYEYNKEKIGPNPDNVKTGMEILIPAKEVYGIDANSAESREKARKLQSKLMSEKK